ncbi:MAG TPA: imidazoleglycerol-phosphate dehydratase HisB [bacterium]|nr:imidazoleglycerol-phosphate dehydratase HisB [bacterium]
MPKKTTKERWALVARKTKETDIEVSMTLDGTGTQDISTGVPFLDHMLTLFARHGRFDLRIQAQGDTQIDAHHTVEDVGICMGKALLEALGDRGGIRRYGHVALPMEEALVLAAIDISGREGFFSALGEMKPKVGEFDVELVPEFFRAFTSNGEFTLHLRVLAGTNTHHVIEALFKACAVALRNAVEVVDPSLKIPSTKGIL